MEDTLIKIALFVVVFVLVGPGSYMIYSYFKKRKKR